MPNYADYTKESLNYHQGRINLTVQHIGLSSNDKENEQTTIQSEPVESWRRKKHNKKSRHLTPKDFNDSTSKPNAKNTPTNHEDLTAYPDHGTEDSKRTSLETTMNLGRPDNRYLMKHKSKKIETVNSSLRSEKIQTSGVVTKPSLVHMNQNTKSMSPLHRTSAEDKDKTLYSVKKHTLKLEIFSMNEIKSWISLLPTKYDIENRIVVIPPDVFERKHGNWRIRKLDSWSIEEGEIYIIPLLFEDLWMLIYFDAITSEAQVVDFCFDSGRTLLRSSGKALNHRLRLELLLCMYGCETFSNRHVHKQCMLF